MQNNNVNKGVFHFFGCENLGAHASIPAWNPSEYVTNVTYQQFFERYEQKGQL